MIAQKEESGIQLQAEEFDLMAAVGDLDEIKEMDQLSVEHNGGTVEQHPSIVEETRSYFELLYNNLAIEVEKVNSVNRKMKETNVELTTELARYKNRETCFEINQEKYDKLERCYQKSVYEEQCLTKKINALHLSSAKMITTLNEEIANLNNQLSKEKSTICSLQQEKKKLKSNSKHAKTSFLINKFNLRIRGNNATCSRESFKKETIEQRIKTTNYAKINHLSEVFVSQKGMSCEELYFSNTSKTASVSKSVSNSISIPNEEFSDDTSPKATKFVRDFKYLAKEADASLDKHKALEFEIERLLRAVVSKDIMSIMQSNYVVDTSNLQTELDRMKEKLEICIIKKEKEYDVIWNDWYKKCEECKYNKSSYDKAYNDMQTQIERLEAQLGDLESKSIDIQCTLNNLDPLSQKLEDENVSLEFQLFDKVSEQKDITKGVESTAKTRRPQPRRNTKKDRAPSAFKSSCRKNKEVEVEEPHRHLLLSMTKKHMSYELNNIKLAIQNDKSELVCAMCKQCLITNNHDVCVLNYVNDMNSRDDKLSANVSKIANQKKHKPKAKKPKKVGSKERLASPEPSKPRTYLRSSKFVNGYGDLQWGNILITRVCFIEGLGHNLFSIGQFCDLDLDVAFRRNTCFVRNLEGVDLLKGNRTTNLYTINLHEMESASPICLMAHATSTKSKYKAPEEIKTILKKITVLLQASVIIERKDNGIEFKNQVLKRYFDSVGIYYQYSSVRTPQQNGVVDQRNRTLVEAARTMLIFSCALLFLWVEAIVTACYTQNRSIIHRQFRKTPYELINSRKPDISFLHVFGALCYPKNDRKDIGKLGAKGDIGFIIGYSANSCAYRVYNRRTKKITETMNMTFDELSAMAFKQRTMYDDYIGGQPSGTPRTYPAALANQNLQTPNASTTVEESAPTPINSSS
ncbi:retrovirus-related pol polyprotein from transposon TNT 1-94 [Tanacetum coccineum]